MIGYFTPDDAPASLFQLGVRLVYRVHTTTLFGNYAIYKYGLYLSHDARGITLVHPHSAPRLITEWLGVREPMFTEEPVLFNVTFCANCLAFGPNNHPGGRCLYGFTRHVPVHDRSHKKFGTEDRQYRRTVRPTEENP